MDAGTVAGMTELGREITSAAKYADENTFGRKTRLVSPRSRYNGRVGSIQGAVPDKEHGLLFLLMIYRLDGEKFLNSAGETRQYRPLSELEFVS